MNTEKRGKICLNCADRQILRFLPCRDHSVIIPSELCGHEHSSAIFTHNGQGITCHDCGTQIILETI